MVISFFLAKGGLEMMLVVLQMIIENLIQCGLNLNLE